MVNLRAVICDLHELATTTKDEETKYKLFTLWANLCRINQAQEALRCSYLHKEETLRISEEHLNRLLSADSLCENVIK